MTITVNEKEYASVDAMIDDINKDFKQRHPFYWWIDNVLFKNNENGLLGYAPHYSLFHPVELIKDFIQSIRWAYQRVSRKWDDRAAWSVDYWMEDIMPNILIRLKNVKHGTPTEFFDSMTCDEDYTYTDEQHAEASRLWDIELDKMIFGFLASKKIKDNYTLTKEEVENLTKVFEVGMQTFVKYYLDLWD